MLQGSRPTKRSAIVLLMTSLLGALWATESKTVDPPTAMGPRAGRAWHDHEAETPILPTGGLGYDSELGLGGELGLFYSRQEIRGIGGRSWAGVEALVELYDQAHGMSVGYAVKGLTIAGLLGYSLRAGYLRNEDPQRLAPDERDYLSLIADGSFMIPTLRLRVTVDPAFDHVSLSAGAFLKF